MCPDDPNRTEAGNTHPVERRAAGPDRGREERRRTPENALHRRRSRRTDLLKRYRQPLIGLGLAGAAVPLVQAKNAEPARGPADHSVDPEAMKAMAAGDSEEQLAARIGETREEEQRTSLIREAVQEFGIREDLASDIYDIAREENIDPEVAFGLVRTESTFNERAVSHVGARGLTQVMPRTAKGIVPGTTAEQLFDRKTNLRLGFRYLDQLIDKYRGNMELALTAYNRGPGTVDKVLKRGGNPDNGYAGKVLGT